MGPSWGIRSLMRGAKRTMAPSALSKVVTPPPNFQPNLALDSRVCSPRYAFQVTPFPAKLKAKLEWKHSWSPFPGLQSKPGLRGMISCSDTSPVCLESKLSGFQNKPEGNFHWVQSKVSKPPLLKPKFAGFQSKMEGNLHWTSWSAAH